MLFVEAITECFHKGAHEAVGGPLEHLLVVVAVSEQVTDEDQAFDFPGELLTGQ